MGNQDAHFYSSLIKQIHRVITYCPYGEKTQRSSVLVGTFHGFYYRIACMYSIVRKGLATLSIFVILHTKPAEEILRGSLWEFSILHFFAHKCHSFLWLSDFLIMHFLSESKKDRRPIAWRHWTMIILGKSVHTNNS